MKEPSDPPRQIDQADRDRERWIAEAAYYRAVKRGFEPGYALEDWLAAEALIDFEISRGADPPGGRAQRG